MAKFQFSRPGAWDYPAIGIVGVVTGDVIDTTFAPDAFWTSVSAGTAVTKTPAASWVPTGYVEPSTGTVYAYDADLNTTVPVVLRQPTDYIEGLPLTIYGHSWTISPGKYCAPGAEWMNRVAARLRMSLSRRGVSGNSMLECCFDVTGAGWRGALTAGTGDNFTGNLRNYAVGNPGVIMLDCEINDAQGANYADATYQLGFQHALRGILAFLAAGARKAPNVGGGATVSGFGGALLGDAKLPNGSMIRSAANGDYVEWAGVTFPAGVTTGHVLSILRPGADFTALDIAVDGVTVVSNWSPSGKMFSYNGHSYGTTAVPFPVTAGSRTIRVTAKGSATFLSDLLVPSATPPLVIVVKDALNLTGYPTYDAIIDSVTAEFATRNVKVLDFAALGWDTASMCGPDATHLTALGHLFLANLVESTIRGYVTSYQAGVTHSLVALT